MNRSKTKWELARRRSPVLPTAPASELHREVLEAPRDRSRFVSGPSGSGKSTLLIQRALYLLRPDGSKDERGIDPSRLLVLTFSRTHADFLRDRIAIGASTIAKEPIARTFPALAFAIVRMALEEDVREPILLSGAEQDQIIRSLLTSELEAGIWPEDLSLALATRGFAKELRDLISRAKEWGLSYRSLAQLGEETKDRNWIAAARFWERMDQISVIRESSVGDPKERIDPSELINRAALYLERSPELRERVAGLFDHILIDHFEESDPSHRRLLTAIAPRAVTLFYDLRSTVGRFRGADPEGLVDFLERFGRDRTDLLPSIDLERSLGQEPERSAHESDSVAGQAQYIAEYLRSRHLRDGIEWRDMAVVVRSPGEHLSTIRRTLSLSNVPVIQERGTQSLAESAAIKPLILIAEIALGQVSLEKENFDRVVELLLSDFGGMDPLRLRRLREEINRTREEGDLRSTDEVILSALQESEVIISFDPHGELRPLAETLRKARKIASMPRATITDLLWEIWSSAKDLRGTLIKDLWRDRVIDGQSLYEVGAADRDLDLIVELFEVARRFTERFPFASPALFIEELRRTTIFGDVIAPVSDGGNRVTLTTVHSAKGSQWKVVVIAGVQEGIWPNLKVRGSLLGSERLVEIQRYGQLPSAELVALSANALAEDEYRLFDFAAHRASEHLLVTAVSREDDLPSPYFYSFAESSDPDMDSDRDRAPLSPTPMIAHLRREVISQDLPIERRSRAAQMLKVLANEGFQAAEPSRWLGFNRWSTQEPLVAEGEEISISPSEIDRFMECQLRWFLEKSGARDGDSQAALLGSAIHAYAQLIANDAVGIEEARTRLERTWHLIDQKTGWAHLHELRRAIRMLDRFFEWHRSNEREVIATEARLDLTLGRVRLRGSADRIELDDEGRIFIVDLKTSSTAMSKEDAKSNLQLSAYQAGATLGGFEVIQASFGEGVRVAGAELIYPATDSKKVTVREQPAIDPEGITATIENEARSMAGNSFLATINSNCRICSVRSICPMQSSGRSVVQE